MARASNVPAIVIAGVTGCVFSVVAGWGLGAYAASGMNPVYSSGYVMPEHRADAVVAESEPLRTDTLRIAAR